MLKYSGYFKLFLITLAALSASCQDNSDSDQQISLAPAKRSINISIVHDNDLKLEKWLLKGLESFKSQNKNDDINFNTISRSVSEAVEEIANGTIKSDAVILPHKEFSALINSRIVNLGSKVGSCQDLIGSNYISVIPAVYLQRASEILNRNLQSATDSNNAPAEGQNSALNKIEVSLSEFNKLLLNSRFGFVHPARSARGSFALLLTIASSSPSFFTENDGNKSIWESTLSEASNLKKNFEWYAPSDSLILKRLKIQNSNIVTNQAIPLGIMSERQLSDSPGLMDDLRVIKISDYSLQEIHSLCISEADWVTDRKKIILRELQKYLISDKALEFAKESGFSLSSSTDNSHIKNIKIIHPEVTLKKDLASFFNKQRAFSIAIDSSASMSPRDLEIARNFALKILDSYPQHTDLLTFSSDITYWNEKYNNIVDLKNEFNRIGPSGGSSIYDSIYRQYRNLERFDDKNFSRDVLIITDGGDKNSIRKLQDLISLVSSNISANSSQRSAFTSLHIIGINNGSGELDNLKSVAEAAVGNFYEVSSDSLPKLLTELESFLL